MPVPVPGAVPSQCQWSVHKQTSRSRNTIDTYNFIVDDNKKICRNSRRAAVPQGKHQFGHKKTRFLVILALLPPTCMCVHNIAGIYLYIHTPYTCAANATTARVSRMRMPATVYFQKNVNGTRCPLLSKVPRASEQGIGGRGASPAAGAATRRTHTHPSSSSLVLKRSVCAAQRPRRHPAGSGTPARLRRFRAPWRAPWRLRASTLWSRQTAVRRSR